MFRRGKIALALLSLASALASAIIASYLTSSVFYASAQEEQMVMKIGKIAIQDQTGKSISQLRVGQSGLIAFEISNNYATTQQYVAILQASSFEGDSTFVKTTAGLLRSEGSETVGFQLTLDEANAYGLKAFVWTSLENPQPLAEPSKTTITVIS
jgi:hypothetical protein